jgi:hypothetical protein
MRKKARGGKSALVGLYRDHKRAEEIWDAYDKAHKAGTREDGEVEAMTAVIRNQVNKGEYISRHLTGRAFDVRTPADRKAFEQVVTEVLGSADSRHLLTNEHYGESHFHVQFDR